MADQRQQQDDDTKHRPSFVGFWKKGKELARGQGRKKEVTFVQTLVGVAEGAVNGESSDTPSQDNTPATPESKAAQRRAQVRRAQIQHRQRKLNYVKELEQEVAKIRREIEDVDKERRVLRAENEGMRAQLGSRSTFETGLLQQQTPPQPRQQIEELQNELWYMSDKMDFTMTMQLGYDEVLGAPCYMVSELSSSFSPSTTTETAVGGGGLVSPESHSATGTTTPISGSGTMLLTPPQTATFGPGSAHAGSSLAGKNITTPTIPTNYHQPELKTPELPYMTPAQIQTAINFILALEHICRDHFHLSQFSSSPTPSSLIPINFHSGHSLMATSLALQSAPSSIFTAAKKTKLFPGSSVNIKPPSEGLEWESSALTLRNLYRLSKVVGNEGKDEIEITPVQAWFELVEEYGLGRVMERMDELKREIGKRKVTVVRCPHFGAVVGRGEWDAMVGEVMGR